MRKSWTWIACVAFVGAALFSGPQDAQARPEYMKGFNTAYPALKDAAETAKCGVCHGTDKKVRNDYGKAVGAALGEPKVKDEKKIEEALKKAEGEKNADGKTFGELIKAGKLPGKAP